MKKLILLVAVVLATFISTFSFASIAESNISASQVMTFRDPDHFPWGSEIPFPWSRIQGTWQTRINGVPAIFGFRTIKTSPEGNQLKIIQFDPKTCAILAQGVGFQENRWVIAAMTTSTHQYLRVTVHVFNRSDMACSHRGMDSSGTVTVLKVNSLGGAADDVNTYELEKVSSSPKAVCQE